MDVVDYCLAQPFLSQYTFGLHGLPCNYPNITGSLVSNNQHVCRGGTNYWVKENKGQPKCNFMTISVDRRYTERAMAALDKDPQTSWCINSTIGYCK